MRAVIARQRTSPGSYHVVASVHRSPRHPPGRRVWGFGIGCLGLGGLVCKVFPLQRMAAVQGYLDHKKHPPSGAAIGPWTQSYCRVLQGGG